MPTDFPDNQDRYILEYEMRHSFHTIVIGVPLKLVIILDKPVNNCQTPVELKPSQPSQSYASESRGIDQHPSFASGRYSWGGSIDHDMLPPGGIQEEFKNDDSNEHRHLRHQIAKWEAISRAWQVELLNKTRGEKHKEMQLWVDLLLDNLRKIYIGI